jgi:hypothetical protein
MFHVKFQSGDNKNVSYLTWMSYSRFMDHVENILYSLDHDRDPIECIQVLSPLQPSVLYEVQDLADEDIVTNILDSVHTYANSEVEKVVQKE